MNLLKKYAGPLLMLAVFETIAVTLWLTMDNLFYPVSYTHLPEQGSASLAARSGAGSARNPRPLPRRRNLPSRPCPRPGS